jgi:DNA-binding HxlR family transcriptional regulator
MQFPDNQTHTQATCNARLAAVGDALYAIGGKWRLRIIVALSEGPRRFNDLQRTVAGISARVLSNELKEMEMNDFLKRNVYVQTPVIVEYELTEYSQTVMPVVQALSEWGTQHRAYVQNKGREERGPVRANASI